MKGIFVLLSLLCLSVPASAGSWETTSLRTPAGGLVRVGMPAHDALRELGPTARRSKNAKSRRGGQTWEFRGDDGLYHITIVHGQVTKIMVTPKRD